MSSGITITRLTLTGQNVEEAEVEFSKGLNVIVGPSDTGKTFIAQCIDFATGAGSRPKEIPEATSYSKIWLEIEAGEDVYVLERALSGGDIRLTKGSSTTMLGAKHKPNDEKTVSGFLLALVDLQQKRVRTKQSGNTRFLSYRDLARFTLIDEERIISSGSPALSGQYAKAPVERSVFKLLLSGQDDSEVIESDPLLVVRSRSEGRKTAIQEILEDAQSDLAALGIKEDFDTLTAMLDAADSQFAAFSSELATRRQSLAEVDRSRREVWAHLKQTQSRLISRSELRSRFQLLENQYATDLKRLEAISQAGGRLEQMLEERCPVCGALAIHHSSEHALPEPSLQEISFSCHVEALKIQTLSSDLKSTLEANEMEIARLKIEVDAAEQRLAGLENEFKRESESTIPSMIDEFRAGQSSRDGLRKALDLHNRIRSLAGALKGKVATKDVKSDVEAQSPEPSGALEEFSLTVEKLLRSWNFPELGRVTFDRLKTDIVVNGRSRASHGKGVRAIMHSAFNLGLLRYCREANLPFPGYVLIDSPLVVYVSPDPEEGQFPIDVKAEFYRTLASGFIEDQVIILENEVPPEDVVASSNVIFFTGGDHGRRGFFPPPRIPKPS